MRSGPPPTDSGANIDWFIFGAGAVGILLVCLPLLLFPVAGKEALAAAFSAVTHSLGSVYLLGALGVLLFLIYLAFSRFGKVVLGRSATPQYSSFSWASMLFCGGIGTSVLYWGTVEWAHYYAELPFGGAAGTPEATRWSMAYPIFHWGFIGWALYCLPGVAIAYAYHVRRIPVLRLSTACQAALGRHTEGWAGRCVDLLFMVGVLGAVTTGVGLAVEMIVAGLTDLLDTEPTFLLDLAVIIIITSVFAFSVYVGLEAGIKRLSVINVGLALLLLCLVFAVGPTKHILALGAASVEHTLLNFVPMSIWIDPSNSSSFDESWTVFYWAWWLALGPFMGMFITKISGGRTIRAVVLGTIGYGTLGCALFFIVLGGAAHHQEMAGHTPVLALVADGQGPQAVVRVLEALGAGGTLLLLFVVICIIFSATSYDSAAYVLASSATKSLPTHAHPARWHRVFWAFAIGGLPISLIYVGGLVSLQSAVVVTSVPLLLVFALLGTALVKGLMADTPRQPNPRPESMQRPGAD